jgi:[acyl-carrier-protein] S-malonyltransferase
MPIKLGMIFPGQGSQSVGMMNAYAGLPGVADVLATATAVLGEDFGALLTDGPAESLNLTVNTQPAMLTAGFAVFRAWMALGGMQPACVAGHSLGEYSALVAAGSLHFPDALALVRYRAEAMQRAVPPGEGAMAAVLNLADDEVRTACAEAAQGGVVEAVNFNAPGQVVIAGDQAAVARAIDACKARGAKRAMSLPVSAPFHSSLMRPAADALRSRLEGVSISSPSMDLVNNVDVCVERLPEKIRDALVRQAAAPVRWSETMQKFADLGVTHLLECGPGKVLAGLAKRCQPSIACIALSDRNAVEAAITGLRNE